VGRGGSARVLDTQSPVPGVTAHHAVVDAGGIHVGDELAAAVDRDRRLDITRNHTATHLLHRALERVLGPHAEQRGSLVAPDRLRFDFSHLRAMEPDEVSAVERRVNEMVRSDAEVAWSIVGLEEARAQGAKMLFGEKYKDRVRLVTIDALSRELCGGTHLRRTGQIGLFLVRSESSVGAGLRRIEALTGRGAEAYVRQELGQLDRLSSLLGAQDSARLAERLQELQQRNRDLERALDEARRSDARSQAERLLGSAAAVDGVRVVAARVVASSMADLREQVDAVRDAAGTSVVVLSALIDGGPRVVAAVSDSLLTRGLHAGALVKAVAGIMGGGGGGRPTLAEAGGKDAALLDQAVAAVPGLVAAALAQGKGSRGAGT
jgi:alanyl-tRNA synthetase